MYKTHKAEEIHKGFHPDGYRIDKDADVMELYTKWEVTSDGEWINPRPTCFHSMPEDGWNKESNV